MKADEIREKFLHYFEKLAHTRESSVSLIPRSDKSLLFVNAGMVPFKNVFSGVEKRPYMRAVSAQRCVRAGGKHNDLENVGYTTRHHTFFEMLGNFSFGDYFKKEAIRYAWVFLTKELNLPVDKFWVSVYEDDDEAERIWIEEIGFPKTRISRLGAKDNFWAMGESGPCGPCSEIFYDHGPQVAGGPPGHADGDGDRFIEVWNLVFTQFDRKTDGHLKPLKKPCVDTGMGLERITAVMQGVHNNYDTDLFSPIIRFIIKLASVKPEHSSVRVIADHIRSSVFLIADGVLPDNEGRCYVLRRIIRRAVRHGHKIGINQIFFYRLTPFVVQKMFNAYPELKKQQAHIEEVLRQEEKSFLKTLSQGLEILESEVKIQKNTAGQKNIGLQKEKVLSGALIFKLYDTYGFPPDLSADIAREHGLKIDMVGFEVQMTRQKIKSRMAGNFTQNAQITFDQSTRFLGYEKKQHRSKIENIIQNGSLIRVIKERDKGVIVLKESVFYPQSGGQVGDTGYLVNDVATFAVTDTQKQSSGAFEHYGKLLAGDLRPGDVVIGRIDKNRRKNIARNHSATHLLHAALREVLGENVLQKGSLVDENKLRFDFAYNDVVLQSDLDKIEEMVNYKILTNTTVYTDIMSLDAAKKKGALALFGEQYNDTVRVLSMGKNDFSVELCGGTHVEVLGDIGSFRIVSQSAVAMGVRRIEAITAHCAYEYDKVLAKQLHEAAYHLKSAPNKVADKVKKMIDTQKKLEKKLLVFEKKLTSAKSDDLIDAVKIINTEKIGEIKLLVARIDNIKIKDLRVLTDRLSQRLKRGIIMLASVEGDDVHLISRVSKILANTYSASDILNAVAEKIGAKGGGRVDMAQGGGGDVHKLKSALASVRDLIH